MISKVIVSILFLWSWYSIPPRVSDDYNSNRAWCDSWMLNVELNNCGEWSNVPAQCVDHVGRYMLDGQYQKDLRFTVNLAREYLHSEEVKAVGDGKDAWVFDIDETTLSNLGYYQENEFGGAPYNRTKYFTWVMEKKATAINETLSLYNELRTMGFSVFFITGRRYMYRDVTADNLLRAGYKDWAGLLMREPDDKPSRVKNLKITKRAQLEKDGYRIWGNMGDQWSDITGDPAGYRTFKLPNPMYYVG